MPQSVERILSSLQTPTRAGRLSIGKRQLCLAAATIAVLLISGFLAARLPERTVTVVPGITGLIDRLEKSGFVVRERCQTDRRVIYVALTEKGHKTLADLDQPLQDLHKKLLGHLTKDELKELSRLLEKARTPWSEDD